MLIELTTRIGEGLTPHQIWVNFAHVIDVQAGELGTVLSLTNGQQLVVDENPATIMFRLEEAGFRIARKVA
jgi:hypothetical protein